jgi:hypothetical protein
MKRIAILIRSGHKLEADTRMAIKQLRSAEIQATEEEHDDLPERVCTYIWLHGDKELDAAMKILLAAGISAIRA